MRERVKTEDLRLRDVVVVDGLMPFPHATVVNITDDEVTFFRPYVHTGDFSYTGGVLHYVGYEKWSVNKLHPQEWEIVLRRECR